MNEVLLLQLPIPRQNFGRKTGNIPLGAACLKQAVQYLPCVRVDVLPESLASYLGDAALLELLKERTPDLFGFSVFGEVKLPWIRSSLIGRYDWFDWDTDGGKSPTSRVIAGHAFHFLPPNDLLFTMEQVTYSDPGIPTDRLLKATLKVEYP